LAVAIAFAALPENPAKSLNYRTLEGHQCLHLQRVPGSSDINCSLLDQLKAANKLLEIGTHSHQYLGS
jgi:hypothetical protein